MNKRLNVAIVGVTGLVGEALLLGLQTRGFPLDKLYPLASARSLGKQVKFSGQTLDVLPLDGFDFSQADVAFFSAGGSVSKQYAPLAAEAGCVVIDNTSCFRYDEDVPLVVPEVNPDCIAAYTTRGIIANPNCSTIQMVVALKPLHDAVGIKRIHVATYQAVSGTGREAAKELMAQLDQLINNKPISRSVYPQQIAMNVLPHIDDFQDNGYTREEMKMVWETQKILEDDKILVNPTAVRVPVLYGHSEAIHLELNSALSPSDARALLSKAPGITVIDDPETLQYPTPVSHAAGRDGVFVGRIRADISNPLGLNLWVVADNVRKGAATNAIQIAEILQEKWLE